MKQGQALRVATRQRPDFRLIAATQVLQKGALSLRQLIQEELAANPALELATDLLCPTCGSPLRGNTCRICSELRFLFPSDGADGGENLSFALPNARDRSSVEQSDLADIAAPISLSEHLRDQAQTALPATDRTLSDYIIANIGDKGLLECSREEISQDLDIPIEDVIRVQQVIMSLDPLGVGACTSQEALTVQLYQLAQEGEVDPWAERIIAACWEDLAYQRYSRIARTLGCPLAAVRSAVNFIKENLNPYPGSAFVSSVRPQAAQSVRWVDLIIHREKADYRVEVVESCESELRVSEAFLRLRRAFAGAARNNANRPSASLESLRRACFFLACLRMRKKTLHDVAQCVIDMQRGYLDTGLEENLRPLTRAKVASLLGKHESTVSRAVADKYVLLPSKQLIAFDKFFTPGAGPKSIIKELIQREARGRPLTDREISRILESRGYVLARRTIAKYRLMLQIPPSSQRRTH
jgi:RNA polymerase sigma-54 factor